MEKIEIWIAQYNNNSAQLWNRCEGNKVRSIEWGENKSREKQQCKKQRDGSDYDRNVY